MLALLTSCPWEVNRQTGTLGWLGSQQERVARLPHLFPSALQSSSFSRMETVRSQGEQVWLKNPWTGVREVKVGRVPGVPTPSPHLTNEPSFMQEQGGNERWCLRHPRQTPFQGADFWEWHVSPRSLKKTLREGTEFSSVEQYVCLRSRDLTVYIFPLRKMRIRQLVGNPVRC